MTENLLNHKRGKKYEFTGKIREYRGVVLKQIILLQTLEFKNNKFEAGTIGGWVESEENLSQEGMCWIDEQSFIYGESIVSDDIIVVNSRIYGESVVSGSGKIISSEIKNTTCQLKNSKLDKSTFYDCTLIGCIESEKTLLSDCDVVHQGLLRIKLLNCRIFASGDTFEIRNTPNEILSLQHVDIEFAEESNRNRAIFGDGEIEYILGREVFCLDLQGCLKLKYVDITNASWVTNRMNEYLIVNGESESKMVQIKDGRTFMLDSQIQGQGIQISGYVCLSHVGMYDYAYVKNDLDEPLEIIQTVLTDCACIERQTYKDEQIENLKLSKDDAFIL